MRFALVVLASLALLVAGCSRAARVIIATPTPDSLPVTWEAYTNQDLGVGLKYPERWETEVKDQKEVYFFDRGRGLLLSVSRHDSTADKGKSLEQIIKAGNDNVAKTDPARHQVDFRTVMVAGRQWVQTSVEYDATADTPASTMRTYNTRAGSDVLFVGISAPSDAFDDALGRYFEPMLQSLTIGK